MVAVRRWKRAAIVVLMAAGTAVWFACIDRTVAPTAPSTPAQLERPTAGPDLRVALVAQERHTDSLMKIPGVVGTAVGLLADGRPGIQLLLERENIPGLPVTLDGVPVTPRVIGRLMVFSDPTKRQRPAPMG